MMELRPNFTKYFGVRPIIGNNLLSSLNTGFDKGELSTSQRQAIITLLDKGKDRQFLKNWCPTSLLNVDYKIGSNVIAERIKNTLPKIIHTNQAGYVKGRQITNNIRIISDILFLCNKENIPGILINIDFEKAFDSVDWDFLRLVMEKMNFGDFIINWIKTFYKNISSCVINNGITSDYFTLGRGVCRGDPLSPYLFLLVVETLASSIRQNKEIKGIKIGEDELKLIQFADDTNGTLEDEKSAK
jgi:hypothetical protein